jgi:hypothetical protein
MGYDAPSSRMAQDAVENLPEMVHRDLVDVVNSGNITRGCRIGKPKGFSGGKEVR